ncbi:NMDA receptor-regulated protein 1-domain-containing protein [Cyathus striatus]|nr:NMDA receptor-regulated protein 1-domain-containing protein [Cyathus striatus]
MSKALGIPAKRALPSKESTLFKELLQLYETRQLKKGLKTADHILKKFPEHGETICMKGLVLTHMGRREEGIDLVKKGIRLDLTSHICWHVFGLIQKGEKNYEEALKSYLQALKFDKDNLNILRDAAQLQTQLRLFDGLTAPNVRQNWIALALAHHLNGTSRRLILMDVPDYDIEHSETLLYYINVLEQLGELNDALSVLDANAKSRAIVDRTAIMETRARILTKLSSEEAPTAWRTLLDHNADCYDYYSGYLSSKHLSLTSPTPETLTQLTELSVALPRVPSLFSDVKSLYSDLEKLPILEEVAKTLLPTEDSDPSTHLWTLYYLAQHHSHLHRHQEALKLLEEALAHTPTLPELHMCVARVLKRAGDPWGAAKALNDARLLDGQDRFLNTSKDAPSPGADLEDMQSMLYLIEEANAHRRNGKLNLALKKFEAIRKIFDEIEDDQYDFHGYNIRKFTLNIYLKYAHFIMTCLHAHSYVSAAIQSAQIFVQVHDDPSIVTSLTTSHGLSDAEKKAKKKAAKKAQQRLSRRKSVPQQAQQEDKGLDVGPAKDEDPEGVKLLSAKDPLEQAAKWVNSLPSIKLLQAVRALNKGHALSPSHPEVHIRTVELKHFASSLSQEPPAPIGPLFTSSISKISLMQHSGSGSAILAVAKAQRILEAPLPEIESAVFTTLDEGVELDIQTATTALAFLTSLKSSRVDEYRKASDAKFELSTF